MPQNMLTNGALFSLNHTIAASLLAPLEAPWVALPGLREFILAIGPTLPEDEYERIAPDVWVARDAVIAPSASVAGPCIIDRGAEIRHCAFIRGSALIGKGAVVGNSTELKNALLFDAVQVPHYNYVGDSILGHRAHMGAGAITSNVKSDKTLVTVRMREEKVETGLKKFGAILGDCVEIGCGSVLNPGTVIGPGCIVYPLSSVRGCIPANHIYKGGDSIIPRRKEE